MNRTVDDPSLYINREASWLAFNRRVLEEANDESNPLLERVKFLAISASNLDEFVEVRVAGLLQRIEDGFIDSGPDALSAAQERELIARETHEFVDEQYECLNNKLLPALDKENIRVLDLKNLNPEQEAFIDDYCEKEVDPLLTPVTVDPAHPFPRVLNKALCIALLLKRKRRASGTYMGVITVPRVLPRLVRLPSTTGVDYIFLADLLTYHAASMYRGYEIISAASFRVTRNSNLYLEEEESRNLLETVRGELHKRRKGDAVRLEIDADVHTEIARRLQQTFELEDWQVFYTQGPVNLSRLFNFYELTSRPDLKFKPFVARELRLPTNTSNIFEELRKRDILLHHPFDTFDAVVDFIETAAQDPEVISAKQTIYRTSRDSPIANALITAANKEKEVIAVLELQARFDEASNIQWARTMEDEGVQVYHGLVGLKTHCKLCLLVRRDPDGVTRRYAHIGTGNYNPTTSRFYTDVSLLTASPQVTAAVHAVFNYLTAYSEAPSYAPLTVSPVDLATSTLALIQREIEHAKAGRPAGIIAKMNALLDKNVIQMLYRASQAGVRIDLSIRGMCSLRPGVPGVSDNITVRSVVGRFLEHSRIFYFENDGDDEVYISSADWMPRNLYERVEVMCPLLDPVLKQRARDEILAAYLADNVKARVLDRHGNYSRVSRRRGQPAFSAQEFLMAVAEGNAGKATIPEPSMPAIKPLSQQESKSNLSQIGYDKESMTIYFFRHASAGKSYVNPKRDEKRPLDETGILQARYIGRLLSNMDIQLDQIISSPLKRAMQTASLAANELAFETGIQTDAALRPESEYEQFQELLARYSRFEAIMVVGHNPSLSEFLTKTISLSTGAAHVNFKKGAVAKVEMSGRSGTLEWLITPRIARTLQTTLKASSRPKTSRK